jgi:hypothetical protein
LNPYKAIICLSIAAPVFAQYAGPAVLSRGEAPAAMATPQVDFRPFLTVTGTYDTGLAGVSVNSQGQLANSDSYGIQLAGGVSGVHSWKHTKISLDYTGSLTHYLEKTYYDATNQSLSLGITHEFSRRVILNLRESGGMFSQNYTSLGLAQTVPFDPSQSFVPVTDFFDNRTLYVTSQADLIYQKNARLSFDFGGDGFINERRSSALNSAKGIVARGDMQYRLTRRTTVGAQYSYTHYTFSGVLGSSNMHGAVATFATRLSRWWEFTGNAGAVRVESKFDRVVPLDPVVAQLLGYATGTQLVYGIQYAPTFTARLSRTFRRGVFWVSGARAVTPGNGLFLTTKMTTATTGYTYTGMRRWSFTAQAMYDRGSSMGNVLGTYGDISGGVSMSRQIVKSLHFVAGADARRYQSPSFTAYNRTVYDAHIGLGFAPGAIPLRLW